MRILTTFSRSIPYVDIPERSDNPEFFQEVNLITLDHSALWRFYCVFPIMRYPDHMSWMRIFRVVCFPGSGFRQRCASLTEALKHSSPAVTHSLLLLTVPQCVIIYVSKHHRPPLGLYEWERRWASGPRWILGTGACLEALGSALEELHKRTHAVQIFLRRTIYENTSRWEDKGKCVCVCKTANYCLLFLVNVHPL